MKKTILAALCAALSCTPALAGPDLQLTSRQDASYGFDGIEGHLYINAALDAEAKRMMAVLLSCSKEKAGVTIMFEHVDDGKIERRDQVGASTVSIGNEEFESDPSESATGSIGYGAQVGTKIASIIKEIYDNANLSPRIRVTRSDGSVRYNTALTGPYVATAVLPKKFTKLVDRDEVQKKVGQFYQLCSIWWSE